MKEKTKAYVGGLIDAEGSIYIGRSVLPTGVISYNPAIRLSSNHKPTLCWVVKHFGGKIYSSRDEEYNWQFSSQKHAQRFLSSVLSYILLKKEEAKVMIEYCEMNGLVDPQKRQILYERMANLKDRQGSVTTITRNFLEWKKNLRSAYLAGLFDGDGWVAISKNPQKKSRGFFYTKTVALAQKETNCLCIHLLSKTFGGNVFRRPERNGSQPQQMWFLQKGELQKIFLLAVLPYLIEKRNRVILMLKILELGREQNAKARDSIWAEMKKLNKKKDRV